MTEESRVNALKLLVVGDGDVATALESIATILGWTPCAATTLQDAERELARSDAVVVLSHHDDVDGPVIAAALARGTPYIAGMGSRKTQERRRRWMLDHGVAAALLDSVHGPAGLDIGANTPAEIALAIAAEIVGWRRGVTGGSLKDRPGPIHPDLSPGAADCPAG
ncbi:MAG: XdhC family protein [Nocardioidaceae bacterium]|nr:XdhC family protein [Nocardioidaceae bacterium]